MNPHPRRAYMCWFGAAWLLVIALILALAAVSVNVGEHWSPTACVLVALSGAALIGMATGCRLRSVTNAPMDQIAHSDAHRKIYGIRCEKLKRGVEERPALREAVRDR